MAVPMCVLFRIWSVFTQVPVAYRLMLTSREIFLKLDQQHRLLIMHRHQFALWVYWSKNSVSYSLGAENSHKRPPLKLCIKSLKVLKRVGGTAKSRISTITCKWYNYVTRRKERIWIPKRFSANWWSWWSHHQHPLAAHLSSKIGNSMD